MKILNIILRNWFILALLVIVIAGAVLRFDRLGSRSLWFDEIVQVEFAKNTTTINDIYNIFQSDEGLHGGRIEPKLSHYIVNRFVHFFGETPFVIRVPFCVAGVITIFVIAATAKVIYGCREGLLAGLLLALLTYHIYFSQEARPYVFLVLFSLCSVYFFYRIVILREYNLKNAIGFLIFTVLNLGNSLLAFHMIGMQLLFVFVYLLFAERVTKKYRVIALVVVLAAILAFGRFIAYGFYIFFKNIAENKDVRFLSLNYDFFREIYKSYFAFCGIGVNAKVIYLVYGVLSVLGIYKIVREKDKWRSMFFLIWLIIPFVCIFTITRPYDYYNPRYLIVILPALIIIISHGFVSVMDGISKYLKVKNSYIFVSGIIILGLLNIQPLYCYHRSEKDNWKQTADFVSRRAGSEDVLLVPLFTNQESFAYYFKCKNRDNILITPYFDGVGALNRYIWFISYLDEDWYWQLNLKDDFKKYKKFKKNIEIVEEKSFDPHPKVIRAVYFDNKRTLPVDFGVCEKKGVLFNTNYKILQPTRYDSKGSFSYIIKSRTKRFTKAYLKITTYVVYKNNGVLIKVPGRVVKNFSSDGKEKRKTFVIDVTELLRKKGEFAVKGILFADSSTSKELFDSRVEKIEMIYDKYLKLRSAAAPINIYESNKRLLNALYRSAKHVWAKESCVMALDLKEFMGAQYNYDEAKKQMGMLWGTDFCYSPLIKLPKGVYVVDIDAFGGPCKNVFPLYKIDILWIHKNQHIKSETIANQYVNSSANVYHSHEFTCEDGDEISVNIKFLNDLYSPETNEDRNLYINSICIKKVK